MTLPIWRWRWRYLAPVAAALSSRFTHAQSLVETYCSSQNTGSDFVEITYHYDSLGYCDTQCHNDYAFAVVQGYNCWCSNYIPADQLSLDLCNEPCPGYGPESCGSTESNLFGYLALTRTPLGTMGASTSSSTIFTSTTSTPTPAETTIYVVSDHTVISTQAIVSTQVKTVAAGYTSEVAVTIYQTLTSTEKVTVVPVASSTSIPSSKTSTSSLSATPVTTTYIQRVTVSGAVVTEIITSVATLANPAAQTSSPAIIEMTKHGLSSGAAAGIAIGVILGLAILGALFFFLCWRPRRHGDDSEGGLNRNTSVLSKAGLLRNTSEKKTTTKRAPQLQTRGLGGYAGSENPMSATTMTSSTSRPAFVDQRLNPNAWTMNHPNTSHSSLGTIHDNRDYSRPLEVRNPDPHNR